MKLGVIADDFTGASDIALTIAEAGMSVAQFIGVPGAPADASLDAGVVALKSRTAPVGAAVADSLAACDWLLAQGVEQVVFKVCSTFDSTPKGNIGPVLEALAARLSANHVLITPAYPENGRCVFMGHLFVGDRLLNESGMQDHPLTPMTDPDLRRVLARQTTWPVAFVPAQTVGKGPAAIAGVLPVAPAMVIVDAIQDTDLLAIGRAAKGHPLVCGGAGIALGLPANFGARSAPPRWDAVKGRGVVLSGSCSRATRRQIETFKRTNPARQFSAEGALTGTETAADLADWVMSQAQPALVYSSADPAEVRKAQEKFGRKVAASAVESLFSALAVELKARGVTRIVVAGGETSGAVVEGLGGSVLGIGPRIAPGVPVVRMGSLPLALALKSGNFGAEDFFARALEVMETAT